MGGERGRIKIEAARVSGDACGVTKIDFCRNHYYLKLQLSQGFFVHWYLLTKSAYEEDERDACLPTSLQ